MRPIDIARKLKVSTHALRHYEEWGIVPKPARGANGYRQYTAEHLAYFECIRAMNPGFGMELIKEVMMDLQERDVHRALWRISKVQADLYQDKLIAEQTVRLLERQELDETSDAPRRTRLTIGQASRQTGIPATAIRHWEKEGLLELPRDQDNGYRIIDRASLRKILLIRTLRTAIYSLELIRNVLQELDNNRIEQAREVARTSLHQLNFKIQQQLRGLHYVYRLCDLLGLIEHNDFMPTYGYDTPGDHANEPE
ncbi:MerR family transcriptional regulator [Paenibacillus sp. 1P07SE]|uniref:MerR family transcriptional regulator n=1 Tax=Paenibacillus sp. 1P07SE TaxID=3132209 RepID=UPI0039A65062